MSCIAVSTTTLGNSAGPSKFPEAGVAAESTVDADKRAPVTMSRKTNDTVCCETAILRIASILDVYDRWIPVLDGSILAVDRQFLECRGSSQGRISA